MPKSLQTRFIVALMGIQVAMLSVLVWSNLDAFRFDASQRLYDTAQTMAAQVAASSARYLLDLDPAGLNAYVGQTTTHSELLYLAIYDADDALIAARGAVPAQEDIVADLDPQAVDDGVLTVILPVESSGEPLGRAVLGFSLELMDARLAEARRRSLLLAAGLVLMTLAAAVLIGRSLTRDLARVSAAVKGYAVNPSALDGLHASTQEVQTVVASLTAMAHDRAAAEAQREETTRFYRSLIERSSDVVIVLDPRGMIVFAGPSIMGVLGYEPGELIGKPLEDFACDAEARKRIRDQLSGTRASDVLELDLCNPAGRVQTLEALWRRDAEKDVFVLNCRDITERRALEIKMRVTEKMEAIGKLTGGVAHDFNNQLAVIMGNLELIAEEDDEEARAEALDQAIRACTRSAELTQNLLSFSRKSHLVPKVVDLNAFVREAGSWMQRTIPASIRFETVFGDGLWLARLDSSALENALLNLVINARDAMPEGGTLTIETANIRIDGTLPETRGEDLPDGQYIVLSVTDSGSGIDKEVMEQVFQPFFTTKPVGAGSGLGLPSVQGFARQSGGAVRICSEPGVGTTVKLFFPALSGATAEAPTETETEMTDTTSGARILVVEDATEVLDVLRRTLEGAGYDVVVARNGDMAFETFMAAPDFDLLVTDIVMPGEMLGTRLASAVREERPDMPVVFLTGFSTEATVYGTGLRPEDIRLMKPVRRVDLLDAVERALSMAHRARREANANQESGS
jgi:PAS domain S-box-containing protein